MSSTLTPSGGECETVAERLAWYANGTLGAADRAVVDAHTSACNACRTMLAIERRIVETMRAPRDNVEQSPHAGWQKLVARLEAEGATASSGFAECASSDSQTRPDSPSSAGVSRGASASRDAGARPARARLNWPAALGAAVAVQAAAIAVLAVALVRHRQGEEAPRFHTLSSADPTLAASGALVRIAFDSSVNEAAARRVAERADARILAGPSPDNVYTFVFAEGTDTSDNLDRKVSGLRRQAHVLLVEPVVVGDPRKGK